MQSQERRCEECGNLCRRDRVRGRCNACYKRLVYRLKRDGTFTSLNSAAGCAPLTERVASHTSKTASCWFWTGEVTPKGYGVLHHRGKRVLAHRASYEAHVGPVPEGLVLDHLCRVRHCVNPAHLEPVTNKVNILRGVGVGATNALRTHCIRGHEFTPENTLRQPPNWPGGPDRRSCRTCRREQNREAQKGRRKRALAKTT